MISMINEPTTTFIMSRVLSALAGLFGGLSISFFWQPQKLYQYGRLAASIIIAAISISSTFALGGIVAHWLGMNFEQADTALGLGYMLGAISLGIIAWLANFFNRREDSDILDIAHELRHAAQGVKSRTTTKKPSLKRTARRRTNEH